MSGVGCTRRGRTCYPFSLTSSPLEGRGFQLLRRLEQQLRFAVHRPGNPVASPRNHGVPRRDVPGRVHVSVAGETAGCAHEARLALARLRVHVPAGRALLTSERGVDLLHPSGGFLFQSAYQESPARPQDFAAEPGLGTDVPAWIPGRPPSRPSHVPDSEIFDPDQVEPACDVRASLLGPVFTRIGVASAQPGDGEPYPLAAVRAPLAAGEPALKAPRPPFANIVSMITDISGEVKRRFLPDPKVGVSAPPFQ
jgi:hypothetical protein